MLMVRKSAPSPVIASLGLLFFTAAEAKAAPAYNPITIGLVAAYEFSGDADDVSGNGNDGVVNGATLTADRFGNANSAYSFDGVDDRVEIGSDLGGFPAYTQSLWVKPDEVTNGVLFQTPNGNLILNRAADEVGAGIIEDRVGGITSNPHTGYRYRASPAPSSSFWVHLAFVAQADNTGVFYVDGVEVVTGPRVTDGGGVSDSPLSAIGSGYRSNKSPNYEGFASGVIDDVYLYDRALSPTEVLTLAAVPEPSTGLLLATGLLGLAVSGRRKRASRCGGDGRVL